MKRYALVVLVFVLCSCPADSARRERMRLAPEYPPGDSVTVDCRTSMEFRSVAVKEGYLFTERHERHRAVYTETVTGPQAMRRRYAKCRAYQRFPPGEWRESPRGMEGHDLEMRRSGTQWLVKREPYMTPRDRMEMRRDAGCSSDALRVDYYPSKPLALGDAWTSESRDLLRAFGIGDSATVQARAREISRLDGHPCLHVTFTATSAGMPDDLRMVVRTQVNGHLYYALDIRRPLRQEGRGEFHSRGQILLRGQPTRVAVDGKLAFRSTAAWIRAGAPRTVALR